MFLRPIEYVSAEDRAALRPKAGDIVVFQGVKYVVDQMGMKYVNMHLLENPRVVGMAKIQEIYKWFPDDAEEERVVNDPLIFEDK